MIKKGLASFVIIVLAALFSGCASAGTKIEQSSVERIQKGKTTKGQLIAALGSPMTASLLGDGREMLFWTYTQTQIKGATFIPFVGLFAGGSDVKMSTLQVILDRNKVVEDFTWNNSNIESRVGR